MYYVMPWYPDGSLQAVVDADGYRNQLPEGLDVLIRVAAALSEIHGAGWAHRDLKPGNVLMDGGAPLLADFGLAISWLAAEGGERLTESAEAVGSRLYIAPENESGLNEDVDQRPADFYAFGKLVWALLLGRSPRAREDQTEPELQLHRLLDNPALRPLDALCKELLNRDPRARLTSWDLVSEELEDVAQQLRGGTSERQYQASS